MELKWGKAIDEEVNNFLKTKIESVVSARKKA